MFYSINFDLRLVIKNKIRRQTGFSAKMTEKLFMRV